MIFRLLLLSSVSVFLACETKTISGQQYYPHQFSNSASSVYYPDVDSKTTSSSSNPGVSPAANATKRKIVSRPKRSISENAKPDSVLAPPISMAADATAANDLSNPVAEPIVDSVNSSDTASNETIVAEPSSKSLVVKMFPTTVGDLIAIDRKIEEILPKLLPAVVALEGGSGVIISRSGFILTASHVTKKANRTVDVRLADGRTVRAITLGTNGNTDTAALKILAPGPWPFIKVGDSTLIQEGDWCLALGYPLSFKRGKPAAVRVGRVLQAAENRIITDCPITGGDSGGPLVNLNGTLIGVSSRIKNDINQNIHIPIQDFSDDWKQLVAAVDTPKTKVSSKPRAYLGILGETDVDRVRIRRVIQGSPAAAAGMLKEDVILQMDGKPIGKFDDVLEVLTIRKPGERVITKLNRFGNVMNVGVQLGSLGGK